jgi:segregation and condensation protein A
MLLPGQRKAAEEDEDEDPRATLQERLTTYEAFKQAAAELGSRPMLGVDVYTNHEAKRLEPEYDHIEKPWIGEPSTLVVLYEQLLKSITERRKPKTVSIKSHNISIEDTITTLQEQLEKLQFLHFQSLYPKFRTRYELVIHIMAILELAKKDGFSLLQPDAHGPLWLYAPNANLEIIGTKPSFGEYADMFELPEGLSMENLIE